MTLAKHRLFVGLFAVVSLICSTATSSAAQLRPVPDPAQRRDIAGRLIANQLSREFQCAEAPAPVIALDLKSFYRPDDPTQSTVDPKRLEEYRVETLRSFTEGTNGMADAYIGIRPRDGRIARCLASWMERWATAGALLANPVTPQSNAERKWILASLALNYALMSDASEMSSEQRQTIERWLGRLAQAWKEAPDFGADRPNNHVNWAALALAATGMAVQDRGLFEEGVQMARQALSRVASDGSLPLEMDRGGRAINYHVFALEPLIVIAEIGVANGVDLYVEHGQALQRLATFTRDAMLDPGPIERRTGVAQSWTGRGGVQPQPEAWGWAFPYLTHVPDPKIRDVLRGMRGASFRQLWLGDMALRFGAGSRAP
jgi:poly(beta-D-mannuronate) lyase